MQITQYDYFLKLIFDKAYIVRKEFFDNIRLIFSAY
ncbi:Uncharacterised protein [uncultured Ruminococcus sp.]|nr:Uncharacterised protein [uncultured Ruminococcus sp.]